MLNPIALARKAIEIGGIIPDDKEYHSLCESAPNIGSRAIFYKLRLPNRDRKGSAALDPTAPDAERIPAIVSFLNPQPALSLGGGNRS